MSAARRPVRERPERAALTPDRIVELAGRPGGFRVSGQWRDQWLLRRCGRLVRAGRLRRIHAGEEGTFHFATVGSDIARAGDNC